MPKIVPQKFFKTSLPVAIVAGGAGFIGSHVCERLLQKRVKVICIDNWQTGVRENIKHLMEDENFYLLEQDVAKGISKTILKVDYVLHLAGLEAYLNGEDVSVETLEVNSAGTKKLLDLAKEKNARFLLASTIDVYSASMEAENIQKYFGGSRIEEGEFSHHEAKRFAEVLVSEYGQKRSTDVRIVRLGDVYGPRMLLSANNIIANFIKNSAYGSTLQVPGDGKNALYPVYVDDVVYGIERALFLSGTKMSIVTLAGPKTSSLSVAQEFRRAKRNEINITFTNLPYPHRSEFNSEVLGAGKNLISWDPKITLEEGVVKTLDWFSENQKPVSVTNHQIPVKEQKIEVQEIKKIDSFWNETEKKDLKEDKKETVQKTQESIPRKRGVLGFTRLIILFGIFWFFLSPFLAMAGGVGNFLLAKSALSKGQIANSLQWGNRASPWFDYAHTIFSYWGFVPGMETISDSLERNASLLAQVASLGEEVQSALRNSEELSEGIFGKTPVSLETTAQELSIELRKIERQLAFIEADLQGKDLEFNFPIVPGIQIAKNSDLEKTREFLVSSAKILPEASDLLGMKEKKRYLILVQDNRELRPAGGVIDSIGVATFDQGKLIDISFQDVALADRQLKGRVEPPAALGQYLEQSNWYLKDANWDPDFPGTAERASWFIDKEYGYSINGVLAIDFEFLKNLLSQLGPVSLNELGDTINTENFYDKGILATENGHISGTQGKESFPLLLSKRLSALITQSPSKNVPALVKAAFLSFGTRHASVWTDLPAVNTTLNEAGWSGALEKVLCSKEKEFCVSDYIQVVEANVGKNKVNEFIKRTYSLDVTLGNEGVGHVLTIAYKNNSQRDRWPEGDYRNYIRIYVPEDAVISSVSLLDPETGKEEQLLVDLAKESGKQIAGMFAVIPFGQQRNMIINWEIPLNALPSIGEYSLLWQKQLGSSRDPVWLKVSIPPGYEIIASPNPSLTQEGVVGYNTNLGKDLPVKIKWQPKH